MELIESICQDENYYYGTLEELEEYGHDNAVRTTYEEYEAMLNKYKERTDIQWLKLSEFKK